MSTEHAIHTLFTEKSKSTATVIKDYGKKIQSDNRQYVDGLFGVVVEKLGKLDKLDTLDSFVLSGVGSNYENDTTSYVQGVDSVGSDSESSDDMPYLFSLNHVGTAFSLDAVFSQIQEKQPISSIELKEYFDKSQREIERFIRVLIRKGLIVTFNGYCEVV